MDALDDGVEVGAVGAADVEAGGGAFGNDVCGGAAVGDDAVDADVGADVLTQVLHAVEEHHDAVEGADAFFGRGGGMGGFAFEDEVDEVEGE